MNFPSTHPSWMWFYFGVFGTAGMVMFILAIMKPIITANPACAQMVGFIPLKGVDSVPEHFAMMNIVHTRPPAGNTNR